MTDEPEFPRPTWTVERTVRGPVRRLLQWMKRGRPSAPRGVDVRRLIALARPEARVLGLGTVFLLASSAATLAYPKAVQIIVDDALIGEKSPGAIDRAALAMLLLFALSSVATSLRYLCFTGAGERIVARLRQALFARVLDQEVGFFDESRTGELMSRLSSDTQVLQSTVSVNISMLLRNLASALGGLILLLTISLKLTGVMILVVPPVAVGAVLYGRRVRRVSKAAQDALAEAGEVAEEALSGIRTVRAFAQEPREQDRYGDAIRRALARAMSLVRLVAVFSGTASFFGGASVAAVLWVGGRMVIEGELSTGELTAFILYTVVIAFSLATLADLWGDFMRASGAASRVFELIDRSPRIPADGGDRLDHVEGRVTFEAVRFAYPSRPDVEVLRGVDLELAPGERVALVGPSGAGKSTIAGLILRFYDPSAGSVRLDGRDLRALDPVALRGHVAVVSQEPILMSASIADNIRYGRNTASDAEVRAAARAANADAFIRSFPSGYDTPVGERGIQLSGGQKQRVAIARAVVRDPRVLILDEATSALDAESEHLVKQALDRLMEGRTTLIIAHRLSTVRDAHRVAVLEAGRLVQLGTHPELMRDEGGLYRRLVERQLREPGPALAG